MTLVDGDANTNTSTNTGTHTGPNIDPSVAAGLERHAATLDSTFASSCGEVRYGSAGTGPDVVLVHGTPTSSAIWRGVIERLCDRYRFHYLDLPGYGRSEQFAGQEVRLRSFARVVAEWVGHLGLDQPILVGHDFGAAAVFGAHLVEALPVSAICIADGVVLSPWGTPFSRHVKEHEEAFAAVPDYIHRATIAAHLTTAMANQPVDERVLASLLEPWMGEGGQAAYYRQVGQYDEAYTELLETRYPAIAVPTKILWGELDRWVPIGEGYRLRELIPGSSLDVLPDAGHFSMLDSPGLFTRYLDAWLGEQTVAR